VNQIIVGYVSIRTVPWFVYNDIARIMQLAIRKTTEGDTYYVIKG
jgi:prophage antirepressor-like protein